MAEVVKAKGLFYTETVRLPEPRRSDGGVRLLKQEIQIFSFEALI